MRAARQGQALVLRMVEQEDKVCRDFDTTELQD